MSPRPVVAVAGGPALLDPPRPLREALTVLGAALQTVDLANDVALPDDVVAFVLGDGAPVPHAEGLSRNAALRASVVALHRRGAPIVAEGGGVAYLAERLDDQPMCDLLPAVARAGRGGVPDAVELTAASDGPLHRAGERRVGRPSAAIALDVTAGGAPAWTLAGRSEGWAAPGLHASLVVVPWTMERTVRLLDAAGART